jgi:hypothetical protein
MPTSPSSFLLAHISSPLLPHIKAFAISSSGLILRSDYSCQLTDTSTMSATLASNGSPTARRATMSNSQSQENNRLEDEKGPGHMVCPLAVHCLMPSWILCVLITAYRVTRICISFHAQESSDIRVHTQCHKFTICITIDPSSE